MACCRDYQPSQYRAGSESARSKRSREEEALRGRYDSFVVQTDVHYPTDINLLFDAMRKVVTLTAQWCEDRGMSD